jgi:hypothetical protein
MLSRTTDAGLSLAELQQIVRDVEGAGYQLQSLCGKQWDGVRFNHLTFNVSAKLPNTGPYTLLIRLAAGTTDPKSDPAVAAALAGGANLLLTSKTYDSDSLVDVVAVR